MTDTSLMLLSGAVLIVGLLTIGLIALLNAQRQRERDSAEIAALARLQADTAVRIDAMREMLADRQAELQRAVNERLDSVTHHLGQSMTVNRQHTVDSISKLNERLAVIDGAQKNITDLASQVTSLQSVLSNKQQRGAFGQARMEIIIQDGLPKGCYEFQFSLSNRSRPDCAIFLPDQRPLIIDAKFPLEAVTALRQAKTDEERRQAAARMRSDIGKHVSDIAGKYLIPGETQDLALMFVPSESVYAELHESFDDLLAEGVPLACGDRVAFAPDVGGECDPVDPARCPHARGGGPDPRRSGAPDGRSQASAGTRAQAAAAFRPGQRGHPSDSGLGRESREARHAHPGGRVRRRRWEPARTSSRRRLRARWWGSNRPYRGRLEPVAVTND